MTFLRFSIFFDSSGIFLSFFWDFYDFRRFFIILCFFILIVYNFSAISDDFCDSSVILCDFM